MAWIQRIVIGFDPGSVPGANLYDINQYVSVAYNVQRGLGKTTTLTIAYQDTETGNWLVGGEPETLALLPMPQYTLDEFVDDDPGNWRTYRYAYKDGSEGHGHAQGFGDIPSGVLNALGVGAPLPLQYLPFPIGEPVVGLKPEPPWSCGPFRASKSSSVWYGDDLNISLTAMAISLKSDLKVVP